jgi:hypothetical protein
MIPLAVRRQGAIGVVDIKVDRVVRMVGALVSAVVMTDRAVIVILACLRSGVLGMRTAVRLPVRLLRVLSVTGITHH